MSPVRGVGVVGCRCGLLLLGSGSLLLVAVGRLPIQPGDSQGSDAEAGSLEQNGPGGVGAKWSAARSLRQQEFGCLARKALGTGA